LSPVFAPLVAWVTIRPDEGEDGEQRRDVCLVVADPSVARGNFTG
jgi:hypothetical protein